MIAKRKRFSRKLSLRIDAIQRQINEVASWPPSMRKNCTLARLRYELAQLEARL